MTDKRFFLEKKKIDISKCAAGAIMLVMLAGCMTACGAKEQAEEVMQPSVEPIPQTEAAEDTENEGALKGRDKLALTIEAMQEDGKDTSLIEGKIKTRGLSFTIPEGFSESKEIADLYITRRYPLDATNIYYVESDPDPVMQYMTEDDYREIVEEKLQETDETIKNFKISEFKEITIDKIPGFRIVSTYTYNELTVTQTEYVINADKTYILTYTMTNEYDRSDLFKESEKTIHVKK